VATEQQLFHLDHRLLGVSPSVIPATTPCVGQFDGDDFMRVGIDAEMQFAPTLTGTNATLLIQPLALAIDLQTRAVDEDMECVPLTSACQLLANPDEATVNSPGFVHQRVSEAILPHPRRTPKFPPLPNPHVPTRSHLDTALLISKRRISDRHCPNLH
jgi:hypothetical protein